MKKGKYALLWLILGIFLSLAGYATVFAASEERETVMDFPSSTEIAVVLNADLTPGYKAPVSDGRAEVTGPCFTAVGENAPEGAVRLVVVPISDEEALAWFGDCVGSRWSCTGVIYAVFWEDAKGERMEAPGVRMRVSLPSGYDNFDVRSVDVDDSSVALDYFATQTEVTFTTDSRLYCGVVHLQGQVSEENVVSPGAPEISLDMSLADLADAVLSDEEREFVDNGIDVHIKLTVEDITNTVSAEEALAVAGVSAGYTVGEYIDIELLKQVGDRPWTNIHETKQPIRITLQIPDRLLTGGADREFALVEVHEGRAVFLPDLDNDRETITFETSEFSTFAILYRDTGSTSPGGPGDPVKPGGAGGTGSTKPDDSGSTKPDDSGTAKPDDSGSTKPDDSGSTKPEDSGSTKPDDSGSTKPEDSGSTKPDDSGSTKPDDSGSTKPEDSGSTKPEDSGSTKPEDSGSTKPEDSGSPKRDAPQTGDNRRLELSIALVLLSAASMYVLWELGRKKRREGR